MFSEKGKLYLVRCPQCEKENYGPTVASGKCAWCGYEAKEEDKEDNKK